MREHRPAGPGRNLAAPAEGGRRGGGPGPGDHRLPLDPGRPAPGLKGQNCNLIDHTQYDHGSLLATVERRYSLPTLTARDAGANDFLHLLSADVMRDAPLTLPDPADSGFSCGDDQPVEREARMAGTVTAVRTPRHDAYGRAPGDAGLAVRPVSATLRGFVEIAAIQPDGPVLTVRQSSSWRSGRPSPAPDAGL